MKLIKEEEHQPPKKKRGRPRKQPKAENHDLEEKEFRAEADAEDIPSPSGDERQGNDVDVREDFEYTREENRAALLRQIEEIEEAYRDKKISFKDKSAQIYAIRFRLQDKFDMDRSGDERRIIVVPQKHDFICPHTNRECSAMPSKEACMKYYNLKEK